MHAEIERDDNLESKIRESEQETKFLKTINNNFVSKAQDFEKFKQEMEKKISEYSMSEIELQQERLLLLEINDRLTQKQSETLKQVKPDDKSEILKLFWYFKQMSFSSLSTLTKLDSKKLETVLEELIAEEIIAPLGETKEPLCKECSSANLESRFFCPKCETSDFEGDDVLEHFSCGNASRRRTYENDVCPQCNKPLKALGVDYIKYKNGVFFCNNCSDSFQKPSLTLVCRKCSVHQSVEDAKWQNAKNYKLIHRV